MKRNLILLVIGLFISLYAYAQRPGNRENMPNDGVIKGRIIDKATNQPIEYANIVLYKAKDSTMLTGTISATDGNFELKELPYGKYYMIVNFIGFQKSIINEIRVNPKQIEYNAGEIKLGSSSTQLGEVEVIADRAKVEYKIDKKVVNVSQDANATTGSAADVLQNVPSINVDIEGNVSLRGSSSFTVLIDGKPCVLQGSDALQQIPASSIENIEIITNPSAKYDPDGLAGIINVVMKKNSNRGINGLINLSAGTGDKYKAEVMLNYKTSKFALTGGVNFADNAMHGKGYSERTTTAGDALVTNFDRVFYRGNLGFKLGGEYFLNDNNSFQIAGEVGRYNFGREFDSKIYSYASSSNLNIYSNSINESERLGKFYKLNGGYTHYFGDKNHKIEALAYFENRNADSEETQNEIAADHNWILSDYSISQVKTTEKDNSNNLRLKLDYTKPIFNDGKIESGLQWIYDTDTENYTAQEFDTLQNQWISSYDFSSEMNFKRNIYAGYFIFSNNFYGFEYMLGLRNEYTDRKITHDKAAEPFIIDRFDFFPTLHISRHLLWEQQVTASYSRRINRPNGRDLDPFPNRRDSYNMRIGNPALEPEYVNSYELSYQKRFKNSYISLETYYRITENKFTRVRTLYDENQVMVTIKNLNKDYAMGSELTFSLEPLRWLNVFTSGNVYYYRIDGEVVEDGSEESTISYDARMNTAFIFSTNSRFQITGHYQGPSISPQGKEFPSFEVGLAYKHEFFDKKLSVSLQLRDIFDSDRHESESITPDFSSYDNFSHEPRVFMIALSYKINNFKKKRGGFESEGEQDGGGGGDF